MRSRMAALLVLVLALGGCGVWSGVRAAPPAEDSWALTSSSDGALEVVHPANWQVQSSGAGLVEMATEGGCVLEVAWGPWPLPAGMSQSEVLDGMLSAADLGCYREGLTFEPGIRRVWMGESFIWHEIQYAAIAGDSCRQCESRYAVEMLAFPNEVGRLEVAFSCPGAERPTQALEQLLLDVVNTITLSPAGVV